MVFAQIASTNKAVAVLNNGGIIAYPAEACFGLGCLIDNEAGVARIRALKSRPATQGLIVVADILERVQAYIDWPSLPESTREKILASWPGPTTWLIPAAKSCPRALTGQHTTLAIRVTDFAPIIALCAGAQSAIISTSANHKGQAPLKTAREVQACFRDKIDAIVDSPIQGLNNPSQIIDARNLQTLRPA